MANIVHRLTCVRQSSPMGCAQACLSMVLGRSITDLPRGLPNTEADYAVFAVSYGLKQLPYQTLSIGGLAKALRKGPLLVGGKLNRPGGHMYVIAGIRGGKIYVMDPSSKGGQGWVNYSTLMTRYPYATVAVFQKK